jgi:dipeptidyl aminopeptidase/acylaminoacyl peptidase
MSRLDDLEEELGELREWQENIRHALDALYRAVDDVLWYSRLDGVAEVDKFRILGPEPSNTTAQGPRGAGQKVRVPIYTFIPTDIDHDQKHPLLVLVHGGVHANFSTTNVHIVEEALQQGYIIVSPEYRGSTGYGELHYKLIDYGGLEVEDTFAARNWMVENCELVDSDRVGIMG